MTYATTDPTSVSSGLTNLAALGIDMNSDGTLTVNQYRDSRAQGNVLHSPFAMCSPPIPRLQNFFTNSNSTGFADNFNSDLTNLTDPSTGVLNGTWPRTRANRTTSTTRSPTFRLRWRPNRRS